jgi:anaerobic ribonucleoside-triphosphate reductase activating protein
MRYSVIRKMDISNGEGCRVSVFTQGCNVHCKGCFNYALWDKTKGKEWTEETEKLVFSLLEPDYILGISWLGGEPSMWADEVAEINKKIKEKFPNKTIWLYSGHVLEELQKKESTNKMLQTVDVLVDGPFIEEQKSTKIPFRGSTNQRILKRTDSGFELMEEYD